MSDSSVALPLEGRRASQRRFVNVDCRHCKRESASGVAQYRLPARRASVSAQNPHPNSQRNSRRPRRELLRAYARDLHRQGARPRLSAHARHRRCVTFRDTGPGHRAPTSLADARGESVANTSMSMSRAPVKSTPTLAGQLLDSARQPPTGEVMHKLWFQ